jgi:hypothetical protein
MATLSDVLTGNHQLRDIAEMSDGLVYVTSTAGFYRLSGEVALTEIARLEGCALSAVTCDVEAVSAPTGSAADAVAYYLHPEGWALAWGSGAAALTELWRYSAGAWSLAAVGEVESPWDIVLIGDSVYVINHPAFGIRAYALKGSTLAEIPVGQGPHNVELHRVCANVTPTRPAFWRGGVYTAKDVLSDVPTANIVRAASHNPSSTDTIVTTPAPGGIGRNVPVIVANRSALNAFFCSGWEMEIGGTVVTSTRTNMKWLRFAGLRVATYDMEAEGLSAAPMIVRGRATGNGAWFVGLAEQGGSRSQKTDTIFLIHPTDLAVHDLTLEWAALDHPPTVEAVTLESATGAGTAKPTIGDLTIEWGAGLGAAAPSVEDLSVESMAQALPVVGGLSVEWGAPVQSYATAEALTVEWATGAGAAMPSVQDLTIEWGAGAGAAMPSVEELAVLWSLGERGRPVVGAAVLEWARYNGPDIVAGEGVLWLTVNDADRPAVAVRVVTDWDMADEAELRCLVRADGEALPVDAWGSYQAFRPGADTYLEQPGNHLRVGIIGPLAQDPPHVRVDVLRVDE